MIKKAIRLTSYVLVLFGFGIVGSCGDDEKKKPYCYECTYDSYTYTYCYADWKADGYTLEEFEEYIDLLVADGYVCEVKD